MLVRLSVVFLFVRLVGWLVDCLFVGLCGCFVVDGGVVGCYFVCMLGGARSI